MNNEKQMMLRRLSSLRFAMVELNLFLDTHPNNTEALKMFKVNSQKYALLLNEYQKKYGPIVASDTFDNTDWEWVNGPWPWESNKEMCK